MSALVSVIVPVYQVQEYLGACLSSLLAQDYQDLEILIIEDCSRDYSLQIAQDFAKRDPRIKIVQNAHNMGLGVARNVGLELANGKYVLFLDSDDSFSDKKAISHCVKLMQKHSLELLCFGYHLAHYDENEKRRTWSLEYVHPDLNQGYFKVFAGRGVLENFYWNTFFAVWMRMYERDFLQRHKLRFIEALRYEDVPFTLQVLAFANRAMISDRCLINYRIRNKSNDNNSITQNSYNCDILQVFQFSYQFLCAQKIYSVKLGYAFLWSLYLNAIITMVGISGEYLREYYQKLRALLQLIAKDYPFLPYTKKIPQNFALYHRRDLLFLVEPSFMVILQNEDPLECMRIMLGASLEQMDPLRINLLDWGAMLIPHLQTLSPRHNLYTIPWYKRLFVYPYLCLLLLFRNRKK